MTYDGTWNYTWRHGRELASMSDGIDDWEFTYDANGMRTKRTNGTATYEYIYNGSQLAYMKKGYETLSFIYGANGPAIVFYNQLPYFYVTNLQGDVIGITSHMGNLVVSYTYDAWGNVTSVTGSMAATLGQLNPLRYRGYVYDQETGLYYLQSRYYNSEIGRFISPDVVYDYDAGLQGFNLFIYCGNNPVNRIDISGADSAKIDDADIIDDEASVRGGSSGGFSGGGWSMLANTVKDAASGLSMAAGNKDTLLSAPRAPDQVNDRYIKNNEIDAHAFKNEAGRVPLGQLSKYNIYKDKADHNRLWVGTNDTKRRDWRMTSYRFDDLVNFWRK